MSIKPNSLCIISDPHGCLKTLLRLIDLAHAKWGDTDLYLNGDLIDRGPDSRGVVEYAMKHKVPTVRANHDDLALSFSRHRAKGYKAKCGHLYDWDVWLRNGGHAALASWGEGTTELPDDVLEWMANLKPYYLIDQPDENGRKLLISHTGFALDADLDTRDGWFRALWGRYGHDIHAFNYDGKGEPRDDGLYRTVGHTPVKEAEVTETFARIDTGCAYGGKLTAFNWPSKETLSIPSID